MAAEGASQLVSVVTLLGAAIIAVPIFKRLSLGSVLGYLAAGLVIGPFGLKLFSDPQAIIHVAELGVVMFLFIIGLEMKPSHLWGCSSNFRLRQYASGRLCGLAYVCWYGFRLFLANLFCWWGGLCFNIYCNCNASVERTRRYC